MKKSLPIITSEMKSDNLRGCPFGLAPIPMVCQNIGENIKNLQPLDDVPADQREKYLAANRKAYRHLMNGERCMFADKFVDERPMVDCDFRDGPGAGEHEFPLTPSPYYARPFAGLNDSFYAYSPSNFVDRGGDNGQLFDGMYFSLYSELTEEKIEKQAANSQEPANLSSLYYEFENSLFSPELGDTRNHSEDDDGNH